MIEKFKALPFGVKVATVFLSTLHLSLFLFIPKTMTTMSIILGIIVAILRVVHYLEHGN